MSMNVLTLNPHGYCLGVHAAIDIAKKAKADHPDANVYLLGMLVHNEGTMADLSALGLIPIDETKESLLDALFDMKKGDVVVFSAHGHPAAYDDIATSRGLIPVDATCRYVKENQSAGEKATTPLIYVGVAGHLEAEAFLANVPEALFYDVKSHSGELLGLVSKTDSPTIITQTTLSGEEIEQALAHIRTLFPHAKLEKERCHSTSLRQKAMASLPSSIDCVIVLGSSRSNNSLKLAEIASKQGYETHLCLGLEEVRKLDLSQKKSVALSSGASTSEETYQEVLTYLRAL